MEKETKSKDNSEIVLLLFGIFFFVLFAIDIELDRDVTTWMWLLLSQLFIINFLIERIKK